MPTVVRNIIDIARDTHEEERDAERERKRQEALERRNVAERRDQPPVRRPEPPDERRERIAQDVARIRGALGKAQAGLQQGVRAAGAVQAAGPWVRSPRPGEQISLREPAETTGLGKPLAKILETAEEEAFAPVGGRITKLGEAAGFVPGEWRFQKPSAEKLAEVFTMTTEEAREYLREQPLATQILSELAIPLLPAEGRNILQALKLAGRGAKLTPAATRRVIGEAAPRLREALLQGERGAAKVSGKPPKPPPVEPPPPTDGMPPRGPLDDSSRTLDYFLGAPKSEDAQRTLIRRYEGQVTTELETSDVAVRGLYDQAKRSGIKFSAQPTREVPDIMQVLDHPGPLNAAIEKLGLSMEDAALARRLRALLDTETALLKRDVPNFSLREFYWPHELVKPKRGVRVFQGRPVGAKPGFTKRRRLEGTLVDILDERPDLVLYSGDPIAVVQRRLYQGALYRQQFVLTEQMKRVGLAVRRSELPEGVSGWRTPKGVVSFNSRPVPGKPDLFTEPWVVPDELARAIEDNFGRSAFVTNIPLNTLRQTVAGLKFAKTFGGLFQHIDYSMRALASATQFRDIRMVATIPRAFGRGFVPGLNAKMARWELTSASIEAVRRRAILGHGLNVHAGLAFMGKEYQALAREFFLYRIPFVGRMLKAFGSATFSNAHREYMLDIGERLMRGYQRAGMTLDEAAAKVALDMNERFSSLPAWQSILRNPTTRDTMRTAFFSMAEQESWIRMPVRQKAFFAAILVDTIALSNMVQLITTGRLLPPEAYLPFVKNPDSPTGFSYNIRFLRPELPWRGPDGRKQYLDLLGQADTPLRIVGDPEMALTTRLGQVPSIVGQVVAGEAAFGGEQLESAQDIGMFVLEQVSPIPGAGFWGEQRRIGLRGAGIQAVGLNVSSERLRDLRNRTTQEELDKPYDELSRQERIDWRKKHPEQFATSADLPEGSPMEQAIELGEERHKRIAALGVEFENGEILGSAYRAGRGDILREIAARRSEIPPSDYTPKTDEDKALDLYYRTLDDRRTASPTNLLQSEDFDAAERAVIEELGEKMGEALHNGLMASADRVEKAYLTDRRTINDSGWWEIRDSRWRAEAAERGLASANMGFDEVRDSIADSLFNEGIEPTPTQIERKLREHGWGDVLDDMADDGIRFRVNHPDIEARLVRWGMGGLSTVRSEDAIDKYRRMTGRDIKPSATGIFRFSDGRTIKNLGRWCEANEHEVCRLV